MGQAEEVFPGLKVEEDRGKLSGTLADTFSAGVHPAGGGRSW